MAMEPPPAPPGALHGHGEPPLHFSPDPGGEASGEPVTAPKNSTFLDTYCNR